MNEFKRLPIPLVIGIWLLYTNIGIPIDCKRNRYRYPNSNKIKQTFLSLTFKDLKTNCLVLLHSAFQPKYFNGVCYSVNKRLITSSAELSSQKGVGDL